MVNSPSSPPSPRHATPPPPDSPWTGSGPSRLYPSNTLIITSLPPPLFHPTLQDSLRSYFASYGDLRTWAPLAGLGRVIVVYGGWGGEDEETGEGRRAAERAKTEMDRFVLDLGNTGVEEGVVGDTPMGEEESLQEMIRRLPRTTFRVYFGPSTSLVPIDPATHHLQLPQSDKNFLISPPGSPPVGWEQIREDEPNRETLAEDLCRALRFLSVGEGAEITLPPDGQDEDIPSDEAGDDMDEDGQAKDIVILSTSPSSAVPSLRVQPTFIETRGRLGPVGPVGGIGNVKATVESMGGGLGAGGSSITPTARPPPPPGAF